MEKVVKVEAKVEAKVAKMFNAKAAIEEAVELHRLSAILAENCEEFSIRSYAVPTRFIGALPGITDQLISPAAMTGKAIGINIALGTMTDADAKIHSSLRDAATIVGLTARALVAGDRYLTMKANNSDALSALCGAARKAVARLS